LHFSIRQKPRAYIKMRTMDGDKVHVELGLLQDGTAVNLFEDLSREYFYGSRWVWGALSMPILAILYTGKKKKKKKKRGRCFWPFYSRNQ
jgi:hypothetical protein